MPATNEHKKKKILYLDIDGVMVSLSKKGQENYPMLVPDAWMFLIWAAETFDEIWYLTCWREEEVKTILPEFNYAYWGDNNKLNGIDWNTDWIWLDDTIFKYEEDELDAKGCRNRYYHIDPQDDYALSKFMLDYITREDK